MLIDVEEARLIPEVPRGSAKPNQRPGRIPASTRTPPRARFQGRERRKAPEGFPKPTSRSAKRLSTRRRRTTLPSRSPDFKGVNAGRPRAILLSDSAAAKRLSTRRRRTILPPRSPDFKGANAGRPRKDFLSQHPAARSARTLAWKPSGAFRWEVKPLRLSTCHHPAGQQ